MSSFSKLSTAACLFSSLSIYAMPPSCRPLNSFEQGHELRQNQIMAAYNATARVDVRGSWDLYTTGSYIYWQPREENLELGIVNALDHTTLPIDGKVINMDFLYKSGFKAGLGILFNQDNWDAYAEYTWLSCHQKSHASADTEETILPFWGHPQNFPNGHTISSAKGLWGLHLDIIDGQLARSYYVGTKLTFRPFFAIRSAWIKQKNTAVYDLDTNKSYHVWNSSHSWGLGPEVGLTTHWLLGYGFRIIGSAETDILFTLYNLHNQEEDWLLTPTNCVSLYQHHLAYLRPHMNLELGLGWGSYFWNHNYHFDIFGTYGFQVFWNQNMFRTFTDSFAIAKSFTPGGDLYIQGVTGELRFDF